MPIELPSCHGEYRWSQQLPVSVSLIATVCLPNHVSIVASFGQDFRNQSLALSFAQSPTGHGHLALTELVHHGCATEPTVTDDLLHLLLNSTVTLLVARCPRQMPLGGVVPSTLLTDRETVAVPWSQWGFQTMSSRQRILARVRNLKLSSVSPRTGLFPTRLKEEAFQWSVR